MATYKCRFCGGSFEINDRTVAACGHCGTMQALPKRTDEKRAALYDQADELLRSGKFQKAAGIYSRLQQEDPSDGAVYWALVLCSQGVTYVQDPQSGKYVPTIQKAASCPIYDDDRFKLALQYADSSQRPIFAQSARAINEVQQTLPPSEEKRSKKLLIFGGIGAVLLVLGIVAALLWPSYLSPMLRYRNAEDLLAQGQYDEAIAEYAALGDYEDAAAKALEAKYAKAGKLLADQDFDGAIALYEQLGDYSDAKLKIPKARYAQAEHLLANQDFDGAIAIFEELNDQYKVTDTTYAKAEALYEKGDYRQAAELYRTIEDYGDSKAKYSEATYQCACQLAEQKDAANTLLQIEKLSDAPEYADRVEQLYLKVIDIYKDKQQYGDALSVYEKTKGYSKQSSTFKELSYQCGVGLLKENNYASARYKFKDASGYSDADQKYKDCSYQLGLEKINAEDYRTAVSIFGEIEAYKDSGEQIMRAKYYYVKTHLSKYNDTTLEYLKDLKAAQYKDSADIYEELYGWKVKIVVNRSEDDLKTDETSISKYDKWYFHVEVTGGEPYASIDLKYTGSFPNGQNHTGGWDSPFYDGYTGWSNFYYNTPKYGKSGTFTFKLYDNAGQLLATKTVKITD